MYLCISFLHSHHSSHRPPITTRGLCKMMLCFRHVKRLSTVLVNQITLRLVIYIIPFPDCSFPAHSRPDATQQLRNDTYPGGRPFLLWFRMSPFCTAIMLVLMLGYQRWLLIARIAPSDTNTLSRLFLPGNLPSRRYTPASEGPISWRSTFIGELCLHVCTGLVLGLILTCQRWLFLVEKIAALFWHPALGRHDSAFFRKRDASCRRGHARLSLSHYQCRIS